MLAPLGSEMVYFMVLKNSTDMTSAMEQHDVGCLEIKTNIYQTLKIKLNESSQVKRQSEQ